MKNDKYTRQYVNKEKDTIVDAFNNFVKQFTVQFVKACSFLFTKGAFYLGRS